MIVVGSEVFPLGQTGFSKGGAFEFRQEQALSLAGGVFIPQGRWAYFSVTCNWVNGEGGSLAEERDAFLRILHNIFRAPGRVLHLTSLRGGGSFRLMFQ